MAPRGATRVILFNLKSCSVWMSKASDYGRKKRKNSSVAMNKMFNINVTPYN